MRFMILLFFLISAQSVSAQLMAEKALQSCAPELQKFCPQDKSPREILECLRKNDAQLSQVCKESLQRWTQAARQASARGGGALASLGGMTGFTPPTPIVIYEGRYVPRKDTPALNEDRLNFSSPVFRNEKDMVTMSLAASRLHFSEPLVLDSLVRVDPNLYRLEFGAQYTHQLEEKKSYSLRGSIGYAGDEVFKKGRDISYSLSGSYSFPTSETTAWSLIVFFSNNSPLGNLVPIPGFLYSTRGEKFNGIFGLPILALQWTPSFPWSYSLTVFGPMVLAEAAYGTIDNFQLFLGYQWMRQLYLLKDRTRSEDRLTLMEMRSLLGVRTPIAEFLASEFQLGYTFERSAFIGDGLFDDNGGRLRLDPGLFLNWNLRYIF